MLDASFLVKKAQALLRLANATDDPTIADRMREMAAHCYSQAELLTEDDPPAEAPNLPGKHRN